MSATHRGPGDRGRRGKWLIGSVAVATVAVGVIASMALGSTPQRHVVTGYAAASTSGGTSANAVLPGDASAGAPTTATASSAPLATTTSTKPSASVSKTSSQGSTSGSGSTSSAGRIQPGVTYNGVATEYAAGDGNGACLYGPAATMMIAAMNYTDYENSKACGDHILVRASDGAEITVLITNECPLPCAPGQLDLSQQAFAKIANRSAGRISVTWQLLSPSDAGSISFRYQTGSSQWWCDIQTIGQRNPVAELEVHTSSGWIRLPRTSYDYFQSAHGAGCGGEIRITDIYGQQLTASGISIEPNVVQPTQLQFAQH
ncbi:expansin EXLX1 family cellulose-binding protein [Actinospica acidithermotolerans]|uniref:expansin EXLX1 family cellulose-binding protein n=1 Tax=Actinospica acidithermotolerans TaxID=2828514 RepID=UPI0027DD597C|nr:expansin EXLX1 family cellulose-binding protein [Actinospica acidithermotolerans]